MTGWERDVRKPKTLPAITYCEDCEQTYSTVEYGKNLPLLQRAYISDAGCDLRIADCGACIYFCMYSQARKGTEEEPVERGDRCGYQGLY